MHPFLLIAMEIHGFLVRVITCTELEFSALSRKDAWMLGFMTQEKGRIEPECFFFFIFSIIT